MELQRVFFFFVLKRLLQLIFRMKRAAVFSFGLIGHKLFIRSNKNKLIQMINHWWDLDLMETDALSLTKKTFFVITLLSCSEPL